MDPNSTLETKGSVTLWIENPGKGKNWGPLLRCCAAFGIGTIFVVGYDQCDVRGSHGASKHVKLVAFPTHDKVLEALKGFQLVGLLPPLEGSIEETLLSVEQRRLAVSPESSVEVATIVRANHSNQKTSFPVHRRDCFPKEICLVVDKLKCGLPWSLGRHCDSFVHIPYSNYNPQGGSMLTLEASVSIVLHQLLSGGWKGYTEEACTHSRTTTYQGQKYKVDKIHKGGKPDDLEGRHKKRKEREEKLQELHDEEEPAPLFFGTDSHGDY